MKELNETRRASHADSQLKLVQSQLQQLELRNEELEAKFADVTKANLDLQGAERELRDQLVTSVSREEMNNLEKKLEVTIFRTAHDRARFAAILEISHYLRSSHHRRTFSRWRTRN